MRWWTNAARAFSADRSITADEVHYGVLDRIGQHGYAFFYFRDPCATAAMVESMATDEGH